MKIWKVGATLSALTCCLGLIAQAQFTPVNAQSEPAISESWTFKGFQLEWLEPSPDCKISSSCVFVVITETSTCSQGVIVNFTISDEEDIYIANQTQIIPLKNFDSGKAYEIGTDSENVAYFAIDDVTCGVGWDTTERYI